MLLPLRTALAWLAAQYLLGVGIDLLLVLDLAQRQAQPPQWSLLGYLCAERAVVVAGFAAVGRLVLYERRTRQALAAYDLDKLVQNEQAWLIYMVRRINGLYLARSGDMRRLWAGNDVGRRGELINHHEREVPGFSGS